jgi:phosphodiesterase/alkaline phosphatase D-like protein
MVAEGSDGKSYTFQSFDAGKYVPANAGSFFPKYTSPLIHSVDLNNLVPGTTYYYRCGDVVSSDLSGIISFTTLPAVGSVLNAKGLPLTFAVLADTSTNGVVNGSLYSGFMNVTSLNILTNTAVGMVLLPGDLSYAGKSVHHIHRGIITNLTISLRNATD